MDPIVTDAWNYVSPKGDRFLVVAVGAGRRRTIDTIWPAGAPAAKLFLRAVQKGLFLDRRDLKQAKNAARRQAKGFRGHGGPKEWSPRIKAQ